MPASAARRSRAGGGASRGAGAARDGRLLASGAEAARGLILALVLAPLVGCAVDQPPPTTATVSAPPGATAAAPTASVADGPLPGFPPCTEAPASNVPVPEGMTLPPGASLATSRDEPPLTYVDGFVPMTPVQVRLWYEESGLTVILGEDEGLESEMLVSDGTHRTFIKTLARCDRGSDFVAVVAPETEAEQVPQPSGSPSGASSAGR